MVENAISHVLGNLMDKFYEHVEKPEVSIVSGREAVVAAYQIQISLKEELYFIHSPSDIPLMGFDTMHKIRTTPARHGINRNAILQPPDSAPINSDGHQRSNLDTTWIEKGQYTMPVEWSVTKSSLLIIIFSAEPHAITITNKLVAGSFLQLWQILSSLLRQQDFHKQHSH